MRFSLATLILVTLWIGAMIAVVLWRHPWEKVSESNDPDLKLTPDFVATSPDGLRECIRTVDTTSMVFIQETTLEPAVPEPDQIRSLTTIWLQDVPLSIRFVDNDTLVFGETIYSSHRPTVTRSYHYRRRFPEWWWGHFYRPEVWCAIVLTVLLGWRFMTRNKFRTHALAAVRPEGTQ